MEEKFCYDMDEKMKDNIKKIIEDSFNENIKNSIESRSLYIRKQLKTIYPENRWNVISIHLNNDIGDGFSYHGKGAIFFCYIKKRGFLIYPTNEKSDLKDKLNDYEIKIKKYESIINEQKSKLEKIISEKELLEKAIKEKENEIINLKNEIEKKKENNSFNKTYHSQEQMITLNFSSTDSKILYTIPCLNKDVFVDVEKKLYDKYPENKEKNINFLSQGKLVLRFKTVEENKLESGIPIVMQVS